MRDPYEVLGVARDAPDETVKKTYRQLCKQYHPDLHAGKPDEKEAEARFLEVQQAYQQIMAERQGKTAGSGPYGGAGNPWGYGGAGPWGFGYGPGYGGYDYGRQADEDNPRMRAAKVYIDARRFAEALHALEEVPPGERGARWYFLNALAQYGLGNTAQAMDYAGQAVRMDPGNVQYRQLLAALQEGGLRYGRQGYPYGRGAGMPNPCVMSLAASLCCSFLGGGGFCLYPILCC